MKPETLITVLIPAILASQGFWSFLIYKIQEKNRRNDLRVRADLVILHDLIYRYCKDAIIRKYTTFEEFDNVTELYGVYEQLGGNGTGKRLYEEFSELPKQHNEIE